MDGHDLTGRVAVVTGASSGIGAATARALAARGAHLALLARRTDRIEQLAGELTESASGSGAAARAWTVDVTDAGRVARTLAEVVADLGGLDILVNNAGIARHQAAVGADLADWDQTVAVNLNGVLYATHAALEPLIAAAARRGVADVVTISSASGRRVPGADTGVYSATKHAVGAFSEALRRELAPRHVRVGLVEPGFVATELTADREFAELEALAAEDVADAVTWMVSRPRRAAINEILLRPLEQVS